MLVLCDLSAYSVVGATTGRPFFIPFANPTENAFRAATPFLRQRPFGEKNNPLHLSKGFGDC